MEPLSPQLRSLLSHLGLATNRDLRRCRPIVRRLARDLPTFDSIWIDALTQTRVLTPFQARILESDQPERLEVGPCILVDELERDGLWTLYTARHRTTRRKCLLTHIKVRIESPARAREGLRELISAVRHLSHPALVLPQGCDEIAERPIVVSPFASGPTLQQLLIRRGRFPVPVVRELARQILDGLSALEKCSWCHGDLRLNTVRLSAGGQAILLHPGVLPAVGAQVSIHDALPAASYDGTAPELISTGSVATGRSDLYSLGCLLWQLLAGRPPFPTGEPLGKLAAHRSREIDDVRQWRPDTPDDLVRLITQLTMKDPESRPSGPSEARDSFRLGARGSRTRLARFHASFGAVAPRHSDSHRSASGFPWKAVATVLLLLSGFSLSLVDAGARSELLRLASRISEPTPAPNEAVASPLQAGSRSLPLPTTPVEGVIELAAGATYKAADLTANRPLSIRCAEGLATILVHDAPMRISAQQLELHGIRFSALHDKSVDEATRVKEAPAVLLAVRAQRLVTNRCRFDHPITDEQRSSIAWMITDEADPSGGRFVARDTAFIGSTRALDVYSMARVIGFDNCLKRGGGTLVRLGSRNRGTSLRIHLRQTTLRDSGPLLQWTAEAATDGLQPAVVVVENSVFSASGADQGLLDFRGTPVIGWERLLQITGEGSLLRPDMELVTIPGAPAVLSELRAEGLLIDDFEFAADDSSTAASHVVATQAPRSTATPPGIDCSRIPDATDQPVVRQAAREYNQL